MRVILLSGKKGHYYNTALGAQKAGYLYMFITTMYFKKFSKKIVQYPKLKSLKFKYISRLESLVCLRCSDKLDDKYIVSIFSPEVLSIFSSKLPVIFGKKIDCMCNYLFELISLVYIKKCDIFHVCSTYAYWTSRLAKKKGAIVIIDQGASHPLHRKNLLKSAYSKYNSNCLLPDEPRMKKTLQEYTFADYIFVPSEYVYKNFIENGGNPNKIFIIPYGVDENKFKPIPKNDQVFRIIYVGLLSLSKGINFLLEAYYQLISDNKIENTELLLIGKIDYSLQPVVSRYEGMYKHIPYVPNHELYKYYSNSSVFVFPSLSEGSSLATYEAMSCGLPSIVTKNSGSQVRDGIDGFVIPIEDVDELKNKILLLYKNNELRIRMGESAKERISVFTWDKYGEEIAKAYRKIIEIEKFKD